jgi:hypothetical protein
MLRKGSPNTREDAEIMKQSLTGSHNEKPMSTYQGVVRSPATAVQMKVSVPNGSVES